MISSPLRSTPSASSPGGSNIAGEKSIIESGSNDSSFPTASLRQNEESMLTPRPHDSGIESGILRSPKSCKNANSSPLKVAASLIRSLDISHTEMTSFAADAAADAERARRNARTAQEIARRYQNRFQPSIKFDSFELSTKTTESVAGSATPSASSNIAASPFKLPGTMSDHETIPKRDFNLNDSEEKDGEEKDGEIDGNQKNKNGDNDDVGIQITTPMASKHRGTQDMALNSTQKKELFKSPTSFERIAQHHADDVLQLTLELERTRQALKLEQRSHRECQASLASVRSKKKKFENVNQKLVEKHEKEQEESRTQVSNLEKELEFSRLRLQAAEEDAQLALDLAKDSAEQRDKIEESFLKAKKEIKMLKEDLDDKLRIVNVGSPKRNVHFADEDSDTVIVSNSTPTATQSKEKPHIVATTRRENAPPRSMIAAGRQLLLRRNMSPQNAVLRLELSPTKSAERRQKLYRRLNCHLNGDGDEDVGVMLLPSSPSRMPSSPTPGNSLAIRGDTSSSMNSTVTKKTLEEYHTAVKILQISGKRLDLNGYWWRDNGTPIQSHNPIQIDVMTRQYCQNVEFKIVRQQKDINQLESLCGYLEKKLFMENK